jgi:hypothetical protein
MLKQNILNFLYGIFIPIISLPIFFDLAFFQFVYSKTPFEASPLIPIPIGVFAYFTLNFVNIIFNPKSNYIYYKYQDTSLYISVIFLFFSSVIIGSLSIVRFIQVIFLFVVSFFIIIPKKIYFLTVMLYLYLLIFNFFHFVSFSSNEILNKYAYVMFFDFEIYQALITYPAVLFLYLVFFVHIFINNSFCSRVFNSIIPFLIFILYYSLVTAARKISLIDIALISLMLFHSMYTSTMKGRFRSIIVLFFFALLTFNSQILLRLFDQIEEEQLDGGRLEIWQDFFNQDFHFSDLIFGFTESTVPAFHSYFLDTFSRIGLLGLLLILFIIYKLFKKFFSFSGFLLNTENIPRIVILLSLFSQITFNSILTQPFYLVNFLFVFSLFGSLPKKFSF